MGVFHGDFDDVDPAVSRQLCPAERGVVSHQAQLDFDGKHRVLSVVVAPAVDRHLVGRSLGWDVDHAGRIPQRALEKALLDARFGLVPEGSADAEATLTLEDMSFDWRGTRDGVVGQIDYRAELTRPGDDELHRAHGHLERTGDRVQWIFEDLVAAAVEELSLKLLASRVQ
jgi:hypothetical protein